MVLCSKKAQVVFFFMAILTHKEHLICSGPGLDCTIVIWIAKKVLKLKFTMAQTRSC